MIVLHDTRKYFHFYDSLNKSFFYWRWKFLSFMLSFHESFFLFSFISWKFNESLMKLSWNERNFHLKKKWKWNERNMIETWRRLLRRSQYINISCHFLSSFISFSFLFHFSIIFLSFLAQVSLRFLSFSLSFCDHESERSACPLQF